MTPAQTYKLLDHLHDYHSRIARALIRAYAQGAKKCKPWRDRAIASEQVVFLFARAVQKQLSK